MKHFIRCNDNNDSSISSNKFDVLKNFYSNLAWPKMKEKSVIALKSMKDHVNSPYVFDKESEEGKEGCCSKARCFQFENHRTWPILLKLPKKLVAAN